jgi:hypothetical protein
MEVKKRRQEHQVLPPIASLMAAISVRAWLMKWQLQVREFVQERKRKKRRGRDVDVFKTSGALRLMYGNAIEDSSGPCLGYDEP